MAAVSTEFHKFIATSEREDRGSGLFARVFKPLQAAQLRAAEREIGRFIALRGGRMTDSLERDIERHFV